MHGSRGCLGCRTDPPQPSKGLRVEGKRVNKYTIAEEFWSTSSGDDMDNHPSHSHTSTSSVGTSNQTLDNISSRTTDDVNHGVLFWNQTRKLWVGSKRSQRSVKAQEPKLSWDTTYESLLGTNKSLPQPIPLSEMVDFLVDVWEQEGLYY